MKYNTITKQVSATVPGGIYDGIDYHGEPPTDVVERAGWVDMTPEIQAQLDAQASLDAEKAAAARKAAQIAAMKPLAELASFYRATLRGIFGAQFPEAEKNRSLTREVVATFFLQQMASGKMTDELRDAQQVLEFGFTQLSPIVGDDPPQTWDLPWEVVP